MCGVEIATILNSKFRSPGVIIRNDILSIPIIIYKNKEKGDYKSMSVTIDLKTGDRLYLEDVITLNEKFAEKLLYEKDFFINIEFIEQSVKEYINNYCNTNEAPPNKAIERLLKTLKNDSTNDEKPKVEEYYLTNNSIVLTRFSNDGASREINIPLRNLKEFLLIKNWEPIGVSLEGLSEQENKGQVNDNQKEYSIKGVLKRISQKEYDNWVKKSYKGYARPNGEQYSLPDIANFDYPYVEGIDNKELSNKINRTIKDAIFNEEFFSNPMCGVEMATTPYSEFISPGVIIRNDILSIPITLYWDGERDNSKSMSVTIDMKTGKRLYLEDIIKLNEEFAMNLLYEKDFFINIDLMGTTAKEYLYTYTYADELPPNKAIKNLLETLRNDVPEDKKPNIDEYYLTKDSIVLTQFADGMPLEYKIPLKNLKGLLKIKSWE